MSGSFLADLLVRSKTLLMLDVMMSRTVVYYKSTCFSSWLTNSLIDIRFVLIDKNSHLSRLGAQSKHNGKTSKQVNRSINLNVCV